MTAGNEISYTLSRSRGSATSAPPGAEPVESISRIARLMALAIRFEALVQDRAVSDYAELARLGGVTRARITQTTKPAAARSRSSGAAAVSA